MHQRQWNYGYLSAEFAGSSMNLDAASNISVRSEAPTGDGHAIRGSKPLAFFEADGPSRVVFCRTHNSDPLSGNNGEVTTLIEVETSLASPQEGIVKCPFRAVALGSVNVMDIAKIDSNHIVASMGTTIDIWKRHPIHGFSELQCVRGCWREQTFIQLVEPRSEDSACLIAAGNSIQCIQLDGHCQKLRSYTENITGEDTVTSIQWHAGERFFFSSTLDTGSVKLYDARVAGGAIAQQFLQRGLFDHVKVSDRTIVCGGLGGVLYVLDTRQLNQIQQSILDPNLHTIHELSASTHGDLLAIGSKGFTLWKAEGKASLSFRALENDNSCNTSGAAGSTMHGSFVSSELAITTDARGDFKQWSIKKMAPLSFRSPAAATSPQLGLNIPTTRAHMPQEAFRTAVQFPPKKPGRKNCLAREALAMPPVPAAGSKKAAAPSWPADIGGRHTQSEQQAYVKAAKAAAAATPGAAPSPAPGTKGATQEDSWDWDLDWKERDKGGDKGEETIPRQAAVLTPKPPRPRTTATGEDCNKDMHALNSKDLDELIGFYLG